MYIYKQYAVLLHIQPHKDSLLNNTVYVCVTLPGPNPSSFPPLSKCCFKWHDIFAIETFQALISGDLILWQNDMMSPVLSHAEVLASGE